MTYEELVQKVHGLAFDLKLFAIFFMNGLPNSLLISSFVMIMYTPHLQHCKLPSYAQHLVDQNTSSSEAILNFFLPTDPEDGSLSKCFKYNRTHQEFVSFWKQTRDNETFSYLNATIVTCEGDKVFNDPYGKRSVVMEFDWTCNNNWLKPLSSVVYLLGISIGSLAGFLSDKFGRKPVFCTSTLILSGMTFLLGFANSDSVYIAMMFLAGLFSLINYVSGFVLGVECTISTKRNFLSISSFISFSCGFGFSSLVGYLTTDWRWLLRVLGIFGTIFIANIWLLPESPRWLMAQGKIEEAKKVFASIARYNGKKNVIEELNNDIDREISSLLEEFKNKSTTQKSNKRNTSFLGICSNFRLRTYSFIISSSWFTVNFLYYGISLSVQALSGNLYVNNTVMGLVEIPGLAVAFLSVKYMRRTITHGGMMALSGIFCLTAALFSKVDPVAASVLALLGKCLNAGAFYLVFIHSVEIYPTIIRNSCTSMGSTVGRIGSLLAPYMAHLGDLYGMYIPFLIESILATITGALIVFGLPETKDKDLPETFEETLRLKTLMDGCRSNVQRRIRKRPKDDSSILEHELNDCSTLYTNTQINE